jgi:protein TonB
MRDPLLSGFSQHSSEENSWLDRVRDNFAQLLNPSSLSTTSANGAPLHLLQVEKAGRSGRAQSASLATHAVIIAILLLLAARTVPTVRDGIPLDPQGRFPLAVPRDLSSILSGPHPSDGKGAGGNLNPVPATRGDLFFRSSIQIVRPMLPDQKDHVLPVDPTILDPSAAPVLAHVNDPGLPWMPLKTGSAGPGTGGIGSKDGKDEGDSQPGKGGRGVAENSYVPGLTMAVCIYCPDPKYSDEAREAKVQGTVTLQVLVAVNGRAAEVRLVKGLGMGLDERAEQAVWTWHFTPAHDASRHAVARWITVEAVYRLF